MYIASDSFLQAMKTKPYVASLTLEDESVIQGDAIQEIIFRGGTNGETEAFTLGGAVSGSAEITLNKALAPAVEQGQRILVDLQIKGEDGAELLPMGEYYVTDPVADDDVLTVKASDALAAKLDRPYEPMDEFDFSSENGVDSTRFLVALCERRGVPVDASNLQPITLCAPPEGFTERQIIGFIAALYGGFAHMDRFGVLRVCSFAKTDQKVTANDYYDGGMMKAEYTFTVQWIKCFNETTELTMIVGDQTAKQGIYLESIWMDNVLLHELWKKLQGFSYVPVEELSFLGNPLIDPGDIITMEDMSGASYQVPVMGITHEYDGGIITKVAAYGQAETKEHGGSINSQIKRIELKAKTYSGIALEDAKKYADALDKALDQLEVLKRLTNETDDAIYMTENGKLALKATAILTGVLDAAIVTVKNLIADNIISGKLKSKDGKTYFDLDSGKIAVEGSDGKLVEILNGVVACRCIDDTLGAALYAGGGNSIGWLILGKCGIVGTTETLKIQTLDEDANQIASKNASWKSIRWVDADGGVHYQKVLVGES